MQWGGRTSGPCSFPPSFGQAPAVLRWTGWSATRAIGYPRRVRLARVACSALLVVSAGWGCAAPSVHTKTPPRGPASVVIPPHPAPVAPGPDVPPAIAPLAGAWEGVLDRGGPLVLVVYRLGPKRARLVLAEGIPGDPESVPWHAFVAADVSMEPRPNLSWREGPVTHRLTLDGPDHLRLSAEGADGVKPAASLDRRPVALLAQAPREIPFVCPVVRDDLATIAAAPETARPGLLDAFEARARAAGGPIVGPSARAATACATFAWRGRADEVVLSGDMNGWSRDRDRLDRVTGTDLFTRSVEFPDDARLDYKLRLDGRWTLDPWNPHQMLGGFGPNSELALPAYRPPTEVTRRPDTPRGKVESLPLVSRRLGNRRKAQVYLPAGYGDGADRYPVLYLHDGEDELAFGALDAVLDTLIAEKVIPPLVAVLVPPLDREREYARDPAFEAFFVEEVVPTVDARYRTVAAPGGRIVGGVSLGALAALSLGLGHPEVFGAVLAHSGAYLRHHPWLAERARVLGNRAPSVWMDVGTFEEDLEGIDLLADNQWVRDVLVAAGVRLRYLEVHEGHSWGSWRKRKREALAFLLGPPGHAR